MKAQKKAISTLLKKPLKRGDTWYVINAKWLRQWKKYVGFYFLDNSPNYVLDITEHPGVIDNGQLLSEDGNLSKKLVKQRDYELIPAEAWDLFVFWYGLVRGQKPIARKVIQHGVFVKSTKVEIYLIDLKLCICAGNMVSKPVTEEFSVSSPLYQLQERMKTLFCVGNEKVVRLWRSNQLRLFDLEVTIEEADLKKGQLLLLEVQNDDGTWPRDDRNSYLSLDTVNEEERGFLGSSVSHSNVGLAEKSLNCTVCFNIMTYPVMLSCGHMFCEKCLHTLSKFEQNMEPCVSCPTCGKFVSENNMRRSFEAECTNLHDPSVKEYPSADGEPIGMKHCLLIQIDDCEKQRHSEVVESSMLSTQQAPFDEKSLDKSIKEDNTEIGRICASKVEVSSKLSTQQACVDQHHFEESVLSTQQACVDQHHFEESVLSTQQACIDQVHFEESVLSTQQTCVDQHHFEESVLSTQQACVGQVHFEESVLSTQQACVDQHHFEESIKPHTTEETSKVQEGSVLSLQKTTTVDPKLCDESNNPCITEEQRNTTEQDIPTSPTLQIPFDPNASNESKKDVPVDNSSSLTNQMKVTFLKQMAKKIGKVFEQMSASDRIIQEKYKAVKANEEQLMAEIDTQKLMLESQLKIEYERIQDKVNNINKDILNGLKEKEELVNTSINDIKALINRINSCTHCKVVCDRDIEMLMKNIQVVCGKLGQESWLGGLSSVTNVKLPEFVFHKSPEIGSLLGDISVKKE